MTIEINPDAGLSSNTAALAAFNRAAQTWSSVFADPITISINAGLTNLGSSSIIGQTNATIVGTSWGTARAALIADAASDPNDAIVASLPTALSVQLPVGFGLTGNIYMSQANAKALGFSTGSGVDGTITFNTSFAFDYDNSDGVTSGQKDFETVALHEIGHVLGFLSAVDDVDYYQHNSTTANINLKPLDLFRFATASAPTDSSTFASGVRQLRPGQDTVFSDTVNDWRMSTGFYTGDGRQASHWKDDSLTGVHIGAMDPTLASGVVFGLSSADIRALDLIGYDAVPEPGTLVLFSFGITLVAWRARRQRQ